MTNFQKFFHVFLIMLIPFLTACENQITKETNMESLYYLTANQAGKVAPAVLNTIKANAKSIKILGPQIYSMNEKGDISGNIDPDLITIAKENNIKLMPLITNQWFNQNLFHQLLQDPKSQKKAIDGMLALCEKYGFWGIQCDFENIKISDKNLFTTFFQKIAARLQQKQFKVSIAVVPRLEKPVYDEYDQWLFDNWSGVYDYKALGQAADFVTVMCYDRHTRLTAPGPIAPADWVELVIQYALPLIPQEKFSLGIPSYSGHWFSGKWAPPSATPMPETSVSRLLLHQAAADSSSVPEIYQYRSMLRQKGYNKIQELVAKFKPQVVWQEDWKSHYAMFTNHTKNEYLFIEDAQSFKARRDLTVKYNLRGFSVWKLGLEDPKIWDIQ